MAYRLAVFMSPGTRAASQTAASTLTPSRRRADDLVSVRGGHAMNGSWILSGILALPLIGALFILLLPRDSEATKRNARWIALFATLITFLLSLVAWGSFASV